MKIFVLLLLFHIVFSQFCDAGGQHNCDEPLCIQKADIIVLIDNSFEPSFCRLSQMSNFTNQLFCDFHSPIPNEYNWFGVRVFSDGHEEILRLTGNKQDQFDSMGLLPPGANDKQLYLGLEAANEMFSRFGRNLVPKYVVVLIHEGSVVEGKEFERAELDALIAMGVEVFVVAFGNIPDESYLMNNVSTTPQHYFRIYTDYESEFPPIRAAIVNSICRVTRFHTTPHYGCQNEDYAPVITIQEGKTFLTVLESEYQCLRVYNPFLEDYTYTAMRVQEDQMICFFSSNDDETLVNFYFSYNNGATWIEDITVPITYHVPDCGGDEPQCDFQDAPDGCTSLDQGWCYNTDLCHCNDGFSGSLCETPRTCGINNFYDEWTCNGKGYCFEQDECICFEDDYQNFNCEDNTCGGWLFWEFGACNSHGTCVGMDTCECNEGWTGEDCLDGPTCYELLWDNPNVCGGHGTCWNEDSCACDSIYSGDTCEFLIVCNGLLANETNVCSNQGVCLPFNETGRCECYTGYVGNDCQEVVTCNGTRFDNETVCKGGRCLQPDICYCPPFMRPTIDGDCEPNDNLNQGVVLETYCNPELQWRIWLQNGRCFNSIFGMTSVYVFILDGDVWMVKMDDDTCPSFPYDTFPSQESIRVGIPASVAECNTDEGHSSFTWEIMDLTSFTPELNSSPGKIMETYKSDQLCLNPAHKVTIRNDFYCVSGSELSNLVSCHNTTHRKGETWNTPSEGCVFTIEPDEVIYAKNDVCEDLGSEAREISCPSNVISCFGYGAAYPHVCSGNGNCMLPDICSCYATHDGPKCDLPYCNALLKGTPGVCSDHGACFDYDFCICDEGWYSTLDGNCIPFVQDPNPIGLRGDSFTQSGCTGEIAVSLYYADQVWVEAQGIFQIIFANRGVALTCSDKTCDNVLDYNEFAIDVCNGNFMMWSHESFLDFINNDLLIFKIMHTNDSDCGEIFAVQGIADGFCLNEDTLHSSIYTKECSSGYVDREYFPTNDCDGTSESTKSMYFDQCYKQEKGLILPSQFTCGYSSCFNVKSTEEDICSGHGECVAVDSCNCTSDYFGEQCNVFVSTDFYLQSDLTKITGLLDLSIVETQVDCNILLDSSTISKIGSSSLCVWNSEGTFEIHIAEVTPDILNVTQITLNLDYFVDNEVMDDYVVPVTFPSTVLITADIITASTISQCDDITLDGSNSYLGFEFVWTLTSGPGMTAINNFLSGLADDVTYVTVPHSLILPSNTFSFSLVTKFGDYSSDPFTVDVQKAGVPLPVAWIESGNNQYTDDSAQLILQGKVFFNPDCYYSDKSIGYSWTQLSGPTIGFDGTKKYLSFPEYSLQSNNSYGFNFNVYSTINMQGSDAEVIVNVLNNELSCNIEGGSVRMISEEQNFTITIVTTDDVREDLNIFNVGCELASTGGGDCIDQFTEMELSLNNNEKINYINSFQLLPGNYLFSTTYEKVDSITSCQQEVIITTERVLEINIETKVDIILKNERLILKSIINYPEGFSSSDYEIIWSLESGDVELLDVNETPINLKTLVIKKDTLTPGQTYTFECLVFDPNGIFPSGYSLKTISVNLPPMGGKCEISPKIGYVIDTQFLVMCNDWNDVDLPLSYRFSYEIKGKYEKVFLKRKTTQNYYEFFLPMHGNNDTNYTLDFSWGVIDNRGSSVEGTEIIQVFPYEGAVEDMVEDFFCDGKEVVFEDKDDELTLLTNTALLLENVGQEPEFEDIRKEVLTYLLSFNDTYSDIPETVETVQIQSAIVKTIVDQSDDVEMKTKASKVVKELVGEKSQDNLTPETTKNLFNILSTLIKGVILRRRRRRRDLLGENISSDEIAITENTLETTTTLTEQIVSDMVVGEPIIPIETENIQGSLVVMDEISVVPVLPAGEIEIVVPVVPILEDPLLDTVAVTVVSFEGLEPVLEEETVTSLVEVNVYNPDVVDPVDGTLIQPEITDIPVEDPLVIDFNSVPESADSTCVYYDEQLGIYSSEGCNTIINPDNTITCQCSHLSYFTVTIPWMCNDILNTLNEVCSGHGECISENICLCDDDWTTMSNDINSLF